MPLFELRPQLRRTKVQGTVKAMTSVAQAVRMKSGLINLPINSNKQEPRSPSQFIWQFIRQIKKFSLRLDKYSS